MLGTAEVHRASVNVHVDPEVCASLHGPPHPPPLADGCSTGFSKVKKGSCKQPFMAALGVNARRPKKLGKVGKLDLPEPRRTESTITPEVLESHCSSTPLLVLVGKEDSNLNESVAPEGQAHQAL